MGIVVQRQTEVTDRLGLILRLCHRTEGHIVYYGGEGLSLCAFEYLRQMRGLYLGEYGDFNIKSAQTLFQVFYFFCGRLFVGTVNEGYLLFRRQFSCRFVCKKHKLLDHHFRLAARPGEYIHTDTVFIKYQLAFGRFYFGSAPLVTKLYPLVRKLVHKLY